MNLDESRIWLRSILPDDPQFTVRQVGPSFPDFHVAEVQLAGETVAVTADAARIEPGLVTEDGSDLRVELLTVVAGGGTTAAALVTAAATMIAQDPHTHSPQPGTMLRDLGEHVDASLTARHGLLVVPWVWDRGVPNMHEVTAGGRHAGGAAHHEFTHPGRLTVVAQLMMLTDPEADYAAAHGVPALQDVLAASGVNLNDVRRPAVAV